MIPETPLQVAGLRFYSPGLGRWTSRDPIGEEGGANLLAFVRNAPILVWDLLGQKCCLRRYHIQWWEHPFGHAVLRCDNGAYVSFYPSGSPLISTGRWRTEAEDQAYWGPNAAFTEQCNGCLDEGAVLSWLVARMAAQPLFIGLLKNCAHMATEAMAAGMSGESKPSCPQCPYNPTWPQHYEVKDALGDIGTPGEALGAFGQLESDGCRRYRCALVPGPL